MRCAAPSLYHRAECVLRIFRPDGSIERRHLCAKHAEIEAGELATNGVTHFRSALQQRLRQVQKLTGKRNDSRATDARPTQQHAAGRLSAGATRQGGAARRPAAFFFDGETVSSPGGGGSVARTFSDEARG